MTFLSMKSGTDPFADLSLSSLSALDGGRTDPCKQDDLAYANDSQISEKVKLPAGCDHVRCTIFTYTDIQAYPSSPTSTDLNPPFQSTPIPGIDEESGIIYHKKTLPPVRGLSPKIGCLYLMKWFESRPRQDLKVF